MIIFAWKVNNPPSFLISLGPAKALNHFFNAICLSHCLLSHNKCLQKHTWALMLFTYLINSNHTDFFPPLMFSVYVEHSAVYVDECNCYIFVVLIQWRQHTSPRHVFTRLPQQTLSCQSQNNVLQEDADGRRNH